MFGRGGGGRISLQISLFPSHYRIASRRPCLFSPPSEKKPDLQSLPTRLPPSPSWPRGGNRHRLHPAQGSAGPPPAPRPAPSPPRARLPPPGAAPSTRGRSAGRGSAEARPPAEPPLRAEEIQWSCRITLGLLPATTLPPSASRAAGPSRPTEPPRRPRGSQSRKGGAGRYLGAVHGHDGPLPWGARRLPCASRCCPRRRHLLSHAPAGQAGGAHCACAQLRRGGAGRGGAACAHACSAGGGGGLWVRVRREVLRRARGGPEEGVQAAGSWVRGHCEGEAEGKLCLQLSGVVWGQGDALSEKPWGGPELRGEPSASWLKRCGRHSAPARVGRSGYSWVICYGEQRWKNTDTKAAGLARGVNSIAKRLGSRQIAFGCRPRAWRRPRGVSSESLHPKSPQGTRAAVVWKKITKWLS